MRNHDNSRVTFGLVSLRTELRKQSHDKARKTAALLRAHHHDAQSDLDAWKRETINVTKTEESK